MKNGNGNELTGSPAKQMQALQERFRKRGLTFRHFADAKCKELRWQAVRTVVEPVTFDDGSTHVLERFELVSFASSSADLITQLEG